MWDTTSIKIKYKLAKNYVVLVYDEKVPKHLWRIDIVTGVLLNRDSETKRNDNENYIAQTSSQLNIHIMTLTKQIRQVNKS